MANIIVLIKDGEESNLTTTSPVIILSSKSILIDGCVRIDTGDRIGMVYNDRTNNVIYLDSGYAAKNQHKPVIRNYLLAIRNAISRS